MISKYLVAVVVLCLAGLLKSEVTGPDYKQGKLIPSDDVCPWEWTRACPSIVVSYGRKYSVANVNGTNQCYSFKRCKTVNDCCDRKRKCQQDYNWHQFTVKGPVQPISVWVNVPATCCCLPYSRSIPTSGCTSKTCP